MGHVNLLFQYNICLWKLRTIILSRVQQKQKKISEEAKCILIKPLNKILTLRIFNIGLSRKIKFSPFFLCFPLDDFLYALQ